MKTISKITIEHIADNDNGNDYNNWTLSDKPSEGCMLYESEVFYSKIEQAEQIISDLEDIIYDEDEKDNYIAMCEKRRDNIQEWIDDSNRHDRNTYRYISFDNIGLPYDSKEYKIYAENMLKRAKEYYNDYWNYIGIRLIAYSECNCCNSTIEISSESLWGIESDSEEYIAEVEKELFETLLNNIKNGNEYSIENINFDDCERID